MIKKSILIISLLACVLLVAAIGASINSQEFSEEGFYTPLMSEPLDKLVDEGINMVTRNEADSALAYFTVVTRRYTPKLSKEDKIVVARAYNGLGYLHFFNNNDFKQSYQMLLCAEEVEREAEDESVLSLIYLNLANILINTDNYEGAVKYYRLAIEYALKHKNWNPYHIGINGLLFQSMVTKDLSDTGDILQLYKRTDTPNNDNKTFTELIASGVDKAARGDYKEALHEFDRAEENAASCLTSERYVYMTQILRSKTHLMARDTLRAISEIEEKLDNMSDMQKISAYSWLQALYKEYGDSAMSDKYKLKFYDLSASLEMLSNPANVENGRVAFELHKMDNKLIAQIEKEQRIRMILTVSLAWGVIIALFAVWIWVSKRKLAQSKEELFRKNQELVMQLKKPSPPTDTVPDDVKTLAVNVPHESESDPELKELAKKVTEIMERSDAIYDSEFTLDKLAQLAEASTRKTSNAINEIIGKNFNTLLSEYRIREACFRLGDARTAQRLTIGAVSEELGFKSRTHFSEVFKKQTGLSPSEYIKIARKKLSE